MGPRKGRIMSKIEVPTDTATEFELGDTAADIQRKRGEIEQRDKGGRRHRNNCRVDREREEARTFNRGGSGRKESKN